MEGDYSTHSSANDGPTSQGTEKSETERTFSSQRFNERSRRCSPFSNSRIAITERTVEESDELLHGHPSNTERLDYNMTSRSSERPTQSTVSTGNPHPKRAARVSNQGPNRSTLKEVDTPRSGVIGLGRATGNSRVPNLELSKSPTLVASSLRILVDRVNSLEDNQRFLVGVGEDLLEGTSASDKTLAEWEAILAQYRQLTMAVTASSSKAVQRLAIPVYEGAADACLLGGNLSFYLSCQSRLLQDLYSEKDSFSLALSRHPEFVSYSFLYFGVFHVDRCELARLMRSVSEKILESPRVKLALSAANAVQMRNGIQFIRIYKNCDTRQRTLMNPRLSSMRATALTELICVYRVLERDFAISLLGLSGESDFLLLLKTHNPALAEHNSLSSPEFRFRLPATSTAVVK